jgi:hypothetical protein
MADTQRPGHLVESDDGPDGMTILPTDIDDGPAAMSRRLAATSSLPRSARWDISVIKPTLGVD